MDFLNYLETAKLKGIDEKIAIDEWHRERDARERDARIKLELEIELEKVKANKEVEIAKVQSQGSQFVHPDALQYSLLKKEFATEIEIFGRVDEGSDTFTDLRKKSSTYKKLENNLNKIASSLGCIVCGWHTDTPKVLRKDGVDIEYPGPSVTCVSKAHIVPRISLCEKLGVSFDQSNFLTLCGASAQKPSCHSAFDRRQLCFIKNPSRDRWTVRTSVDGIYAFLNGMEVDLTAFQPHQRILHGHALSCIINGQVVLQSAETHLDLVRTPEELSPEDSASQVG